MNQNYAKNIKIKRSTAENWSYNLVPWPHLMIPLSTLTGGHCSFAKKRAVTVLLDGWCSAVCSSSRSHRTQVQHPVIYKPVLPSGVLGCSLSPTTHDSYPHYYFGEIFVSENLQICIAIICLRLTALVPYIIKREILHQARKVLFKAQSLLIFSTLFAMWLPTG